MQLKSIEITRAHDLWSSSLRTHKCVYVAVLCVCRQTIYIFDHSNLYLRLPSLVSDHAAPGLASLAKVLSKCLMFGTLSVQHGTTHFPYP